MDLVKSVRDYYIRRIIKKGKEKKVYDMLWSANYIFKNILAPPPNRKSNETF